MAAPPSLTIPAELAARGVFDAAGESAVGRPEGRNFNGGDLAIWLVLVDAARHHKDGIVSVRQSVFRNYLGKASPGRIAAAMERLRGTDLLLGETIPLIKAAEQVGERTERNWIVELDHRLIRLVSRAVEAKLTFSVPIMDLAPLTSRYSLVLYLRYRAWTLRFYPGKEIKFGQDRDLPTFELSIPVDHLGQIFGFKGGMKPALMRRLLVTKSAQCPLKSELLKLDITVDSVASGNRTLGRTDTLSMFVYHSAPGKLDFIRMTREKREMTIAQRREWGRQLRERENSGSDKMPSA